MSMLAVRSMQPGERSLPAELRTARGRGFAQRRLANGMRGVSGGGISGLAAIGVCDFEGDPTCEGGAPVDFNPPPFQSNDPIFSPTQPSDPCPGGVLVDGVCQSSLNSPGTGATYTPPTNWSGPTSVPKGTAPPAPPSGYQWVAAANSLNQNLAKVLAITQGGTVMQLPNGQQIITGTPGANVGLLSGAGAVGQISQYMPYVLLVGGAVLLMSFMRGR